MSACVHDSIECSTAIDMFLRSGNTTRLDGVLPDVRIREKLKMAANNQKKL